MIRLAFAVTCIFLSACAHRQEPPPVAQALPKPSGTKVPRPEPLAKPTDVRKEYGCDKKVLPFLAIESQKLIPSEPQAGQEFTHIFVYAACVSDDKTPIQGTLIRKISFIKGKRKGKGKGKVIFQSANYGFEIKPGKWKHIAIIKTPPGTPSGQYEFQISISSPKNPSPPQTSVFPFVIKK